MNITPEVITYATLGIIALAALIVAFNKVFDAVVGLHKKVTAPEERQNNRIQLLEESDKKIYALLDRDDKRLRILEEGSSASTIALFALLGHAIDGNNEQECKDARKEINNYLIKK